MQGALASGRPWREPRGQGQVLVLVPPRQPHGAAASPLAKVTGHSSCSHVLCASPGLQQPGPSGPRRDGSPAAAPGGALSLWVPSPASLVSPSLIKQRSCGVTHSHTISPPKRAQCQCSFVALVVVSVALGYAECAAVRAKGRVSHHPRESPCRPAVATPLGPWQLLFCFLYRFFLPIPDISYKWTHTACGLLCPVPCAQHNAFKAHPRCSSSQHPVPFHG